MMLKKCYKHRRSVTAGLLNNADELVLKLYQQIINNKLDSQIATMLKRVALKMQVQLRMHVHHALREYQFSYLMKARMHWLHMRNLMNLMDKREVLVTREWTESCDLMDEIGDSIQRLLNQISDRIQRNEKLLSSKRRNPYPNEHSEVVQVDSKTMNASEKDTAFGVIEMVQDEYYIYADEEAEYKSSVSSLILRK